MMVEYKNRKVGLDILRIIGAFLIVCIHAPFQGEFGKYFISISRCAVPIFFIITGFFYNEKMSDLAKNKQILKIFKICIFSNLFYFALKICMCLIKGNSCILLLENIFNKKSLIYLFVFNESPIYGHLWYLNALLYVLIIMKFITKHNMIKYMYIITPILLVLDLICGKYSLLLLQKEIPYIYIRNFLFVGIPYFCVGNYINKNIIDKISEKSIKKYIFLIIFFAVTSVLERYFLVVFNLNSTRDHYISTTGLSIFLFIYFLLYKENYKKINEFGYCIAKIGKEYSTLIYILHPVIIELLNIVFKGMYLYEIFYPIIVFMVTFILCVAYRKFIQTVNLKKYIT